MESEKYENETRTFFFGYFFEPTEICLGLPKWTFLLGKEHFTPGKTWESDSPPPKKKIVILYASAFVTFTFCLFICPQL